MHPYYGPGMHPAPFFGRMDEPALKRLCNPSGGVGFEVAAVQHLLRNPVADVTTVQNLLDLQQEIVVFEQWQRRQQQQRDVAAAAAAAQQAAVVQQAAAAAAAQQAALRFFAQQVVPQAQPMRTVSPPCTHKVRSQPSRKMPAGESEAWRLAGRGPPPEQLHIPEQSKDDTLNNSPLFSPENFKSTCPNERGRGAFAAAALCLVERTGVATGHVYAVRSNQYVDRWLLNRMPGRTQSLLQFVNGIVGGMLGLKPFPTWRALARSLGDSRQYLPARHWCCLELKGGGNNASAKQPWQAYRTVAGHFDRLADELQVTLISTQQPKAAPFESNLTARQVQSGPPVLQTAPPQTSAAEGAKRKRQKSDVPLPPSALSVTGGVQQAGREEAESKGSVAVSLAKRQQLQLQLQHRSKRAGLLLSGKGGGPSAATARPFYSAEELKAGLQADWDHCVAMVQRTI